MKYIGSIKKIEIKSEIIKFIYYNQSLMDNIF